MSGEYFKLALLGALGVLLIAACVTDLRSRIISNRLNLAIAAMAPLWWVASGLELWPGMAVQLGVALIVFALFTSLFAIGCMG
ncbi:MAG TPA: prepilin peptidase, partial [Sphingobium sp.]